jgi:hypothetical protein
MQPLRDVARSAVDAARPFAGDAVDGVLRIVDDGNGADRQRAAFANDGIQGVLDELVRLTRG